MCFEGSEGSDEIQYFQGVTIRLDAAPFAAKDAVTVDDEGAALDAANRFPVQLLVLDDGKLLAAPLYERQFKPIPEKTLAATMYEIAENFASTGRTRIIN